MIKNFEEVKKQLAELSNILNKFKSEQVQLKIVELVFKGAAVPQASDPGNSPSDDPHPKKKRTRRARTKKVGPVSEHANGKKRVSRGMGPMPTLEQFIQEGYFAQKRAIGAIVEHCKTKARNFKNSELSTPLGRLVRNGKLSRTKNSDGQWEYIKK